MSAVDSSAPLALADCAVGTVLPELALPLDRTLIVATAIASQDFEDVHHDPDKALERGTPDIFMSINSTNGFIDRYITDVFGPGVRILKVALRLGAPNFPGDTMTFSATVDSVEDGFVAVSLAGKNSQGVHVSAQVRLAPTQSQEGDRR